MAHPPIAQPTRAIARRAFNLYIVSDLLMLVPMPRRPWFQYHLSTAIVLMFVAGGLLWANMRPQLKMPVPVDQPREDWFSKHYGWPVVARTSPGIIEKAAHHLCSDPPEFNKYSSAEKWIPGGMATDILTALAILAAVAFVCEWLIRRKPLPQPLSSAERGAAPAGEATANRKSS